MFFMCLIVFIALITLAILTKLLLRKKSKSIYLKHLVITGGSSGIGKSLAILAAQKGAHVTIIARNQNRLTNALNEIKEHVVDEKQIINALSIDLSDYKALESEICAVDEELPIFGLVNCAGFAICRKLEDYTVEDINSLINSNLLGTIYLTKILVTKLKQRQEGFIVMTGSQGSLMGIFGLSVYSSTKFAIRGFAESVDMEVRHYNVSVTLALPADTDTPGFEQENKGKPLETQLICASGNLFKSEEVAAQILQDSLEGKFLSYLGVESHILTTLCVGMTPFSSVFEILEQFIFLGALRAIFCVVLLRFHGIVKKCMKSSTKID